MRARLLSVGLFKPDYSGQPRMPDKKVEVRRWGHCGSSDQDGTVWWL